MNSIWRANTQLPHFDRLDRDLKTDVLIIGGGLAGILCAWMLEQQGVDYVLVEARRICSGVTGNTTAKITVQHGLIYDKLLRHAGRERAAMYLEANRRALEQYRALGRTADCAMEERDAYVYTLDRPERIERELRAYHALGCPAEWARDLPLPFPTAGAVRVPDQLQFDPLRFVERLVPGLRIYEDTPVLEMLSPHLARTREGRITAQKVICATHFPFINKHGGYFIRMHQERSYVIALKNAADVRGMYIDEAAHGLSFRNAGELLLLGGGGGRTGKRNGSWEELRQYAGRFYPQAEETACWAAQDCMTLDSIPYIGRYSRATPDFYVATGFQKWGMTTSMAAAMILTDQICGRKNDCAAAFTPQRSSLHLQLGANLAESAIGFLTPTARRCPHLGCALKWNPAERTWDCPCHGSRFDSQGRLLDDPAQGDLP